MAELYNKWSKEAIINRSEELTKELIRIFPIPNIKEVGNEEITGEYTIDQTTDVTGKKPVQITVGENKYSVKTWRQILVTFLNDIWNKDSLNYERIKENHQLNRLLFRPNNSPEKLDNGTVIETNFSATVILAIIAKISEICDITDQGSYAVK